jgi:hypothetical protein
LGSAVCALSTAVKEGFGFSFLEPWTAGRGIFGRRIEYVCADFERSGVRFDGLYPALAIPLDDVSIDNVTRTMESAMRRIYESFGMEAPPRLMRALTDDLEGRTTIDFGRLDEALQETIIRACHKDAGKRRQIAAINPMLKAIGDWHEDRELIESNRRAIAEQYGGERIVELLLNIYRSVAQRPVQQRLSKPALLELYLDPLRLSLTGISNG